MKPGVATPAGPRALLATIRQKYAAWILVAGAVIAAVAFVPHLPRERHVDLRLDEPASVTGVDLAWRSLNEPAPVQGTSWHFALGQAPLTLPTNVSLVDGRYDLDIMIHRGVEHQQLHRSITLGEADRITVPLR
jgi:hypothetical protein